MYVYVYMYLYIYIYIYIYVYIYIYIYIYICRKTVNNDPRGRNDLLILINHSFHFDRCYQFFYILSDYNPLFTLHIYIYIGTYIHIHIYLHTYIHIFTYISANININIDTYKYIFIYNVPSISLQTFWTGI